LLRTLIDGSDLKRGARNPAITIIEELAKALKLKAGSLLD